MTGKRGQGGQLSFDRIMINSKDLVSEERSVETVKPSTDMTRRRRGRGQLGFKITPVTCNNNILSLAGQLEGSPKRFMDLKKKYSCKKVTLYRNVDTVYHRK